MSHKQASLLAVAGQQKKEEELEMTRPVAGDWMMA